MFAESGAFVWRTLRHLGVADADLDDACQEVFMVAHRKADTFRGEATLETWLYGICRRQASSYRRRAHRRREVLSENVPEAVAEAPQVARIAAEQRRRLLLELLDALSPEQRETFVLYEIEELEMSRVAEMMQCPVQTAYYRLHAARERIRSAYAARTGEGAES
jgi:RNA polymerase sigma-70 factor (ECF subfamily)